MDFIDTLDNNPEIVHDFVEDVRGGKREGAGRKQRKGGKPGSKARKAQQFGRQTKRFERALGGRTFQDVNYQEVDPKTISKEIAKQFTTTIGENHAMVPVQSSFVKGMGLYQGNLAIEFNHDPRIWVYPLGTKQSQAFFNEMLLSDSKGGFVWDELLMRPSKHGMAKGKFYSWTEGGEQQFATSKGAQFKHRVKRPIPISRAHMEEELGYHQGLNREQFEQLATFEKEFKEKIVEPPKSRERMMGEKLKQEQQRGDKLMAEIKEWGRTQPKGIPKKDFERFVRDFMEQMEGSDFEREDLEKKPLSEEDYSIACFGSSCKPYKQYLKEWEEKEFQKSTLKYLKSEKENVSKEHSELSSKIKELKERKQIWEDKTSEMEDKTLHNKRIHKLTQEIKGLEKKEESLFYKGKELKSNIKEVKGKIKGTGKGRGWHGESGRHSTAAKKGKKKDFEREDLEGKKVKALRMGENAEGHRSKDLVVEILKWSFPTHRRGKRQEWWNNLLKKIPEIKKYVGETKETDRPQDAPKELLSKVAKFIVKNDPIYESHGLDDDYKFLEGLEDQETPALIMKGLNVNAGTESEDLVYNASVGAIVEGEIIGENTWGDGEVMINHKVLYEFDPKDIKEILEGMYRYGEDVFLGFWLQSDLEELYEKENYNEYIEEWEDEELDEFKERIEKEKDESSGKGRGWHGEPERHAQAAKKGKQLIKKDEDMEVVRVRDLVEDGADKDNDGRWITITGEEEGDGRHIKLKPGYKLKFGKDGKYKQVKKGSKGEKGDKKRKKEVPERKEIGKREKKSPKEPKKEEPKKEPSKQEKDKKSRIMREVAKIDKQIEIAKLDRKIRLKERKERIIEKGKKITKLKETQKEPKKEEPKQAKRMPKEPPKKDPDEPPKGYMYNEKSGKLEKIKKETPKKKVPKKEPKEKKPKEKKEPKEKKYKKGKFFERLLKAIETGSAKPLEASFRGDLVVKTTPIIKTLTTDFMDTSDWKVDFTEDYTHMYGPITHGRKGGHFDYRDPKDPKKIIRLYKDYNSLKESTKVDYFPLMGTQGKGSHKASIIGFTYGFDYNDDTEQVFAHSVLFNNLEDISDIDLTIPRQVSIGFDDEIVGDIQFVKKIDHLAMSLDNDEIGRCELGGKSCYQKIKEDMGDMREDNEKEGRWVTMRGTHVFIKKGQSPKEALNETIGKKKAKKEERIRKEKKITSELAEIRSKREKKEKKFREMTKEEQENKFLDISMKKGYLKGRLKEAKEGSKEEIKILGWLDDLSMKKKWLTKLSKEEDKKRALRYKDDMCPYGIKKITPVIKTTEVLTITEKR